MEEEKDEVEVRGDRGARVEEGKGRKVWVGYGKIKTDELWWKWNEEKEMLRNWRGITRTEKGGEEEREKDRGLK